MADLKSDNPNPKDSDVKDDNQTLVADSEEGQGNLGDDKGGNDKGDPDSNPPKKPDSRNPDPIAKARQEEKDKLYPRISELENQIKTLEKGNGDLKVEVASLTSELEGVRQSMSDTNSEKNDAEEAITSLKIEFDTKLDAAKQELDKRLRDKDLELYREKKLRESGDQIISELVTGTSEEEIDKSVEMSMNKFKEILEKGKSGLDPKPAPPAPPAPGPLLTPETFTPDKAKKSTNVDWTKNRESAFAAAKAAFEATTQNKG